MEESIMRLNQTGIGTIHLDPTAIRGEGGSTDPALVVPIRVELYQQPSAHQLLLVRLTASLHHAQHPDQRHQFGPTVSYDLLYNMPMRSLTVGSSTSQLDLFFRLTLAQLHAIEQMRHQPGNNLYLHLEPVIAWNKHTGNNQDARPGGVSTLGEHGWDVGVGLFSEVAFFWLAAIGTLRVDLAAVDWATKVFPGLGYDRFRLIEVRLPISDVLVPTQAIAHFKEALQDYDRGAHGECLRKCRFVLDAIEQHIRPQPQGHRLGTAISQVLGWSITPRPSEQAAFLDNAWMALYIMANAAHHTPSSQSLLPADARIVLLTTATMLEYLAQLQ